MAELPESPIFITTSIEENERAFREKLEAIGPNVLKARSNVKHMSIDPKKDPGLIENSHISPEYIDRVIAERRPNLVVVKDGAEANTMIRSRS